MNDTIRLLSNYSLFLPAIIALLRFHQVEERFHLLFLLIWIGAANEGLSQLLIQNGYQTGTNNNAYVLLEGILILLIFYQNRFLQRKGIFLLSLGFLAGLWLYEAFFLRTIAQPLVYYRIFYSFIIVLLCISTINQLIDLPSKGLLTNPFFLLCVAFILYFTLKALVFSFWLYGLGNMNFLRNLHAIMLYTNLFMNILLNFVVLYIPRKQPSLLSA